MAESQADRDHAFQVILGERDNLTVPQIWEGLSTAEQAVMLRLTEESRPERTPADMTDLPCRSLGLVVGWSTVTNLGRAVAEYGRAQS